MPAAGDPRGHDADNTLMPVPLPRHDGGMMHGIEMGIHPCLHLQGDIALDSLPLAVLLIELRCDPGGLIGIVG